MNIQLFAPQRASDKDWDKFFAHREDIHAEIRPNDPPPSRESMKKFVLDPHPHYETCYWAAISNADETIIGLADMNRTTRNSPDYETNETMAEVDISVGRAYRRCGIGTSLLQIAVANALEGQLTTLQGKFHVDSGRAFSTSIGARITNERYQRRLYLDDLNWHLVEHWIQVSRQSAPGTSVEIHECVPDADMEAYCRLYNETALQTPEFAEGDYVQSSSMTPKFRRDTEQVAREKGGRWVTLLLRESDGALSGFTEIDYYSCYPHFLEQGMTGVLDTYRGFGRGMLLKTEMLMHIRRAFPQIRYIMTGNDNGNDGILHINSKLGFKKDFAETLVTLDVLGLKEKFRL